MRKPKAPDKPGRPFYTAEFLAEAQRRIEHTTESMTSIAGKFGMHHSVLSNLIQREGWVRPEAALHRRGLSPAMRLAAAADALAAAPAPPDPAALDRIEQAVLAELATVETMRASLDKEPLRPIDAERTARTLSIHTETLAKLRRHRLAAAAPAGTDHDDDVPADIDDFRIELARRIDVFVASRTEPAMLSEMPDLRRWIEFDRDFITLAHRHQEPPAAANNGGPWTTWLMLGGRGAGKTRLGAEWVRAQAHGHRALCRRAARCTSRWSARPSTTCAR